MNGLLLVGIPPNLVDRIRRDFEAPVIDEISRSDQVETVLQRRVAAFEALLIGPECSDIAAVAEQLSHADAALSLVVLSRPAERDRVAKAIRFMTAPGLDVREFVLNEERLLPEVLDAACVATRQRRAHRARLSAIQDESRHVSVRSLAKRLQSSEDRYRIVVETAIDAIVTVDEDGTILLANPATEKIFGYAVGELLTRQLTMLIPEVRDSNYRAEWRRNARKVESANSWEAIEISGVHKTGREIPLEVSFGEFDASGRRQFTGILRDISERKRQEQRLQEAAAELAQRNRDLAFANRELEEFSSIASHDLQEPLRKIVSYAELLREDMGEALPEAAGIDLEFITDGALRMRGLIADLLALSHAGQSPLSLEPVAVEDCVACAAQDLELLIEQSGARLDCAELPVVTADAVLLTGIYRNLIGNALKFSGEKPASIRLSAECADEEWVLGVSDQGIGIPEHQREEVFKPFRRLQAARGSPGSGIGLAFCRKAVERQGGRIWVDSDPDGCTHFRFTLASGATR